MILCRLNRHRWSFPEPTMKAIRGWLDGSHRDAVLVRSCQRGCGAMEQMGGGGRWRRIAG